MMTRTDRFASIGAFLEEKRRLTEKRDLHAARIEQHWHALKDKKVRADLASNALQDVLGMWKPARFLGSLIGNGSMGASLGMAFGSGKGGWLKRAALFGLGMIAPKMLKRAQELSVEDIIHEVGVSVDHVRDHLRSRKRTHAEAECPIPGDNS